MSHFSHTKKWAWDLTGTVQHSYIQPYVKGPEMKIITVYTHLSSRYRHCIGRHCSKKVLRFGYTDDAKIEGKQKFYWCMSAWALLPTSHNHSFFIYKWSVFILRLYDFVNMSRSFPQKKVLFPWLLVLEKTPFRQQYGYFSQNKKSLWTRADWQNL